MATLTDKISELETALTGAGLTVIERDRYSLLEAPRSLIEGAAQVLLVGSSGVFLDTMAASSWSVANLRVDVASFLGTERSQAEDRLTNYIRAVFDAVILSGLAFPDGPVNISSFPNERVLIASVPVRVVHSH